MRPITKPVMVYSNEITVKDHATLTALIEQLNDEVDNLTECQHTRVFHEIAPETWDEPTYDNYFYMLEGYCIGSLVIVYIPNTQPNHHPENKGTIEATFTITLSDDIGEEAFFHQVQDTFNPIFLMSEK